MTTERRRARRREWYAINAEKISEQRKARYYANPEPKRQAAREGMRRIRGRDVYGMAPDDYRNMVVGQAGRCLICGLVPERDLVVDHNHDTGMIRGLLCTRCNSGIGMLGDNPNTALSAARYLGAVA